MPVLTQRQYEGMASKKAIPIIKKKVSLKSEKKVEIPKVTYILLHPENGIFDRQNLEDEVELNGVKHKRICKNGIVRTTDKILADFLLTQEYRLLGENNE